MELESKTSLRIMVVERDPSFRTQLEQWIAVSDRLHCVGSFATADEALPRIPQDRPEVVLLDISFPCQDVCRLLPVMKSHSPELRALVISDLASQEVVLDALQMGADGFCEKQGLTCEQLGRELLETFSGNVPLSPGARKLLLKLMNHERPDPKLWILLTARQQQIAQLLQKGYPDKEMARSLSISLWTLKTHLKELYKRLRVTDRFGVRTKLWGAG